MKSETQSAAVIEAIGVALAAPASASRPLVEGIDWRVMEGEFWVVGGLHWAGKSALLLTAAGLQRPQRGRHLLFGRDTDQLHEDELMRERLRLGLVFEDGGRLFAGLTVAENVALPLCYHRNCPAGEAEDRVRAVLEATGLLDVARRTPGAISRQLRQRVGLARALILDPEALLLDNPVAGFDPPERSWWLDFLGDLAAGHEVLARRRLTLVVTTSDLVPWADRGNRFAVIRQREWVAIGGRDALRASTEPLLRDLMAAGTVRK